MSVSDKREIRFLEILTEGEISEVTIKAQEAAPHLKPHLSTPQDIEFLFTEYALLVGPPGYRRDVVSTSEFVITPVSIIVHYWNTAGNFGYQYFENIKQASLAVLWAENLIDYWMDCYWSDNCRPKIDSKCLHVANIIELVDEWARYTGEYEEAIKAIKRIFNLNSYRYSPCFLTLREFIETGTGQYYFSSEEILDEAVYKFGENIFDYTDDGQWKWILSKLQSTDDSSEF